MNFRSRGSLEGNCHLGLVSFHSNDFFRSIDDFWLRPTYKLFVCIIISLLNIPSALESVTVSETSEKGPCPASLTAATRKEYSMSTLRLGTVKLVAEIGWVVASDHRLEVASLDSTT